jgi:hypothetical protein
MGELISDTYRVAAKPHRCYDCMRDIAKGERHRVMVGRHEGHIYTLRSHTDCFDASQHYIADWYPGDYEDGLEPLAEMIWNGDGQGDLDWLRGYFPHVVCRIELSQQLADLAREKRLAEIRANREAESNVAA